MKDERKGYNNINEMFLWAGLVLLGIHFYVHLQTFFAGLGLASPLSDKLVGGFVRNSTLLSSQWTLKLMAGGGLCLFGFANRGVKSVTLTARGVLKTLIIALALFVGSTFILTNAGWFLNMAGVNQISIAYIVLSSAGGLYLIKGTQGMNRVLNVRPGSDKFNRENETFPQEERKLDNKYSVNIPTEYIYQGNRRGWLNISAPFRALLVMGTPGSGKTYGVIHQVIRQHIEKGFSMYVYDYKYPSLTMVTYNAMTRHRRKLPVGIKFYNINFDNPRKSHRCNPLHISYLHRSDTAIESARMIMMNLNRNWITKQGDFFVESPINYVAALIWFLRTYDKGQYCSFPHLVELITRNYRELLPILMERPEIVSLTASFASAYQGGAVDQLEGTMSSAQIALARLASPALYWTMSGNDFSLDINNPKEPKILCLGNNQELENTYGAALGLYNYRILTLLNRPNQHRSSVVIDELPTIYFKGLSRLISTARSNEVAVTIGMQDYSQLEEDYGRVQAETIKNTCGNIVSGQVFDKTAESMQNRLGKIVQRKDSINIQSEDTTHGISTELNFMVPAAKIGQLTQGWMVGVLADNEGQESPNKAFHARLAIDKEDFKAEQKAKELPDFSIFATEDATMDEKVLANYHQIKDDIARIVQIELDRLNDKYNK